MHLKITCFDECVLFDRLSCHVLALTRDVNNMKCHVRLKMKKMLQKCKRCWLHQSDFFHYKSASRKRFLSTIDLEGEDVFLFWDKKDKHFEKCGRNFFCPEIGETDPVIPIFTSSLCSWLLLQILSITKRYKSVLLAQIKLAHIVANNNAASLSVWRGATEFNITETWVTLHLACAIALCIQIYLCLEKSGFVFSLALCRCEVGVVEELLTVVTLYKLHPILNL